MRGSGNHQPVFTTAASAPTNSVRSIRVALSTRHILACITRAEHFMVLVVPVVARAVHVYLRSQVFTDILRRHFNIRTVLVHDFDSGETRATVVDGNSRGPNQSFAHDPETAAGFKRPSRSQLARYRLAIRAQDRLIPTVICHLEDQLLNWLRRGIDDTHT